MLISVSGSQLHASRLTLLPAPFRDVSIATNLLFLPHPFIQKCPLFSKSKQRHEFDVIQDLLQSSPTKTRAPNTPSPTFPTTLEREALLVGGSPDFSLRQREEAMNSLLDLLEHKGVTTAYAFGFIRHAGDVVNELIVDARASNPGKSGDGIRHFHDVGEDNSLLSSSSSFSETSDARKDIVGISCSAETVRDGKLVRVGDECDGDDNVGKETKESLVLFERKPCLRQERSKGIVGSSPFSTRVYKSAERRGLGRLVLYFEVLNMKACHIPSLLPLTGGRIDVVLARVEFLRSIGIASARIPSILAAWPQILSYECDSLASIVEYLKEMVELSNKEFVRMIVKYPSILGYSVTEIDQNVNYVKEIGMSAKEARSFFVREPELLMHNLKIKLGKLVDYFTSIGLRRNHIGSILLHRPALINCDPENDLSPVVNYLRSLHASPDDIDKIVSSFPGVFFYDLEKDFKATVSQLESVGLKPSVMGKLFRKYPLLLKSRMNFGPKLQFLMDLGLEKSDLGRVIYNAPQLLSLNVDEKILPTVKFLEGIGIRGSLLRKLLRLKPMVLAYNVETKLQPNINFLEDLGIEPIRIGRLVARHPQLLTLSIEKNLDPTVRQLLKFGFTKSEVTEMVLRLPSLLSFSVSDVIKPKYNYAIHVMKRSLQELVRFPQFFSYSLKGRIVPRHIRLGSISSSYSLSTIYGCRDSDFNLKLSKWNSSPNDD